MGILDDVNHALKQDVEDGKTWEDSKDKVILMVLASIADSLQIIAGTCEETEYLLSHIKY